LYWAHGQISVITVADLQFLIAAHSQVRVDASAKNFGFEIFLENSRMATAMVFQPHEVMFTLHP
jgi:hypothetical protein